MFAFLSSGTELRRFSKGVLPRMAIIVLLFIPLLYGALYLWAFWNPTEKMDNLPVALVNQDVSTTSTDGTVVDAGQELVTELLDRQDLKWTLTDADTAATGVQNGDYYFSVTIPKDFSTDIASPATDNPTSAQIQVSYNDANSFLASTLGKSAMTELRDTVATEIGDTQVNTVLVGLNDASSGMSDAADGASKIADGATTAQDGSSTITVGLQTLVDGMGELGTGTSSLATGAQKLSAGAATLDTGLASAKSGASSLSSGVTKLSTGASTLSSGLTKLDTAVNKSGTGLADGVDELNSGTQQLATAVNQSGTGLADGVSSLSTGLTALSTAVSESGGLADSVDALSQGASQVSSGLTSLQAATAYCAAATSTAPAEFQKLCATLEATIGTTTTAGPLTAGAGAVADGLSTAATEVSQTGGLADSVKQLAAGGTALNKGVNGTGGLASSVTKLAAGTSSLDAGVNGKDGLASSVTKLADGASTLSTGASTAASGASTLSSGVSKLATGASQLSDGLVTVSTGANTLADGVSSASSGVTKLHDGSSSLTDGVGKLADGATTLSTELADGADQTNQGTQDQVDAKSSTIADPVTLDQTWTNEASSWGEGFAPFFISLALFVGGIITWLLLHALPHRAIAAGVSGIRATLAGFLPAAVFGVGQVAIMMAVLILGLGLSPNFMVGTLFFVLLTALTFLALQQMFIITLGTAAGRVLALALLMFQLSSSGGTYPVETTPEFFKIIHPWMPISYVVTGLRQLMTGQLDEQLWISVAVLAGTLIGSLAISSFAAGRQRVWSMARLHPEIAI